MKVDIYSLLREQGLDDAEMLAELTQTTEELKEKQAKIAEAKAAAEKAQRNQLLDEARQDLIYDIEEYLDCLGLIPEDADDGFWDTLEKTLFKKLKNVEKAILNGSYKSTRYKFFF